MIFIRISGYKQATFLEIAALLFIPFAILGSDFSSASDAKISLQIVSEVYKKQPYIPVPTASIEISLRNEILNQIRGAINGKWQADLAILEGEWVESLRCRPALNIGIYLQHGPENSRKLSGILLIYPKNYRGLIEDPLATNPPPILYLGSTRKLAFYHYPQIIDEEIRSRLAESLKLQ